MAIFHRIKKIASGNLLTKVEEGWVYEQGEFKKVWSGASEVSYYDGNTLIGIAEVDDGEDVLHPSITVPTKTGYNFVGWSKTKGSTTPIQTLLADGDPITLYAVYQIKVSTVYYYNEGTLLGTAHVTYGNSVLNPSITIPTRTGYDFKGWTKTRGYTTPLTSLTADGNTITLYTIYTIKVSTVSYYNGGTLLGRTSVAYGNDVLHPSITSPTRAGYNFVGWNTVNGASSPLSTLTANGSAMTLYAAFQIKTSNVTYYDGDTIIGTQIFEYGRDVLHPSINTTKSGYTLYGWATTKGSETRVTSLLATGSPMTLYAIYIPNSITVASGTVTEDGSYWHYTEASRDSNYITGTLGGYATRQASTVGPDWLRISCPFNINYGLYQRATITYAFGTNRMDISPVGYFDGVSKEVTIGYQGQPTTYYNSVTGAAHTLSMEAYDADGWATIGCGVTSIVLSNPIAWV